jgi:hypothetical protein
MNGTHCRPSASAAFLGGFDIINGYPPGPSDPNITEVQPFPTNDCVARHRATWRQIRHCHTGNR